MSTKDSGSPQRQRDDQDLAGLSAEDMRRMVRELQLQNEELRRSQAHLELTRAHYFDLYDEAPVSYCSVSQAGLILEANLNAATLLGVARSALIQQPLKGYILAEDQDIYQRLQQALIDTGQPSSGQLRMLKSDGNLFWAQLAASAARPAEGAPWLRIILSDITELKRAKEALRESERRNRTLVEWAPEAIAVHRDGIIIYVNPAALKLAGAGSADELIGKSILDLVHPDFHQAALTRAKEIAELGVSVPAVEQKFLKLDGTVYDVEVQGTSIVYDGLPANLTAIRDISARRLADAALQEKEQFARAIADSVPGRLSYWTRELRCNFANQGYKAWYERTAKQLQGIGLQELLGEELFRKNQPYVQAVLAGQNQHYERAWVMPNGETRYFWVQYHAHTIDGEVQGFFSLVTDITAVKQAERTLASSAELLELTGGLARVGGWEIELPGMKVVWSRETCRILEVDSVESPAFDLALNFYAPEARPIIRAAIQAGIDQGTPWDIELPLITAKGQPRWVRVQGSAMMVDGKAVKLFGAMQDISERKVAEEARRLNQSLLQQMSNSSPLAFLVVDTRSDAILHFNQRFCEIWGIEHLAEGMRNGQLKNRDILAERLRMLADAPAFSASWAALQDETNRSTTEDEIAFIQGRTIRRFSTQIRDDADRYYGRFYIFEEITARKQAEADKAKLVAQLQQAQKMESVGRLAGGVAHDFNNMLGVIIGHTELALQQVDPTQLLYEDLSEVYDAAERSADLTRQLLAFARKQTIAPKVLDLNSTVTGLLSMLRRLIGEDITVTLQPAADLWPVMMDPSQMDQLLTNLCVNARDAIADVGAIAISTENCVIQANFCAAQVDALPGDYVRLSLSDTGCGMNSATMAQIFEPFFTTKGVGEGTGLGLASVYGAVKQNDGFLMVSSEPGEGTTFHIYLPRYAGPARPTPKTAAAPPARSGVETILLVEDEAKVLQLTQRLLQAQGYVVIPANTSEEALRLAQEHAGEIHLILTDVVMPDINGQALANALLELYPGLKRLFMSGYPAETITQRGILDAGMPFIQKPFTVDDLAAKVQAALDAESG